VLETPHVVVGAAIASKIANPAIALPLALASHFLLDKVPHWNPHINTEKKKYGRITKSTNNFVFLDVATSLILGFAIAFKAYPDINHFTWILVASFVAIVPDLAEVPYYYLNSKSKFIANWVRTQKSLQVDASIIPGLATQFATILAVFAWIR